MTNLGALAGIIGGLCGLCGIPTLLVLMMQARRQAQALRDKPLVDALHEMKEDRDYWRAKCDNLESRMQGRQ